MAEARMRHEWTTTATQMALTANIHRDPRKSSAFSPLDFHPMVEAKKKTVSIDALKSVFVDRRTP